MATVSAPSGQTPPVGGRAFDRAGVTVELDVPARMRDGVTLRANVYRPTGPGPWPTLLTRLPYGKDDPRLTSFWLDPVKAARHGFMTVVQDTRGRNASEGEWVPFHFERRDGHDTVEWAARLPGSSGRVGMYGCSYFGNTQWMAALERPPSLAAICPSITWSDPLDGLLGRGGALELGFTLRWALQTGAGHIARMPIPAAERERRLAALLDEWDRLPADGYWELPVTEQAVLRRHEVPDPGTFRMLSDPGVLADLRVAGEHERVTVPSLSIGGWYDTFLQGTLDNYMAMASLGRPARLVIGPWSHDEAAADPVGERCFGMRASAFGVPVHEGGDVGDLQLRWFARQLGDGAAPLEPEPVAPVRIFVMGRNVWRDEPAWPLRRARPVRWFLHAGGALSADAPDGEQQPTRFAYDPADPVPTVGGPAVMPTFPPGAFDQRRVEERADVCVFTSEPLQDDLEVTGRVRVVLHADSSAPSTDWVARLCDVHPDGRSFNVCDGIVRIAECADEGGRHEVDLWSTSNVFLGGHRVRVHVTSSCFPRWDRNLNTGRQQERDVRVAHQRIHHASERPSWIELPVVDG